MKGASIGLSYHLHSSASRHDSRTEVEFRQVEHTQVPIALLLEDDPLQERVLSYLPECLCFVAVKDKSVVGACAVKPLAHQLGELFNIAVQPNQQTKGIGTQSLTFTLAQRKAGGFHRVELGTGAFGYQLRYYQRLGFRVDSVVKNHFLEHYSEAIYGDSVQHKDMSRLYLKLAD